MSGQRMVVHASLAEAPADDAERLALLHALDLLDSAPDPVLDGLTRSAARALGCPMALISLVDADRQWFKSRVGVSAQQTAREVSLCTHTITGEQPLVVADTWLDPRFNHSPLVRGELKLRFYAGVPLRLQGHALGTLCVMDERPRQLSQDQIEQLTDLSRAVEHWLQARQDHQRRQQSLREEVTRRTAELDQALQDAEQAHAAKSAYLAMMSHEIRTPLHGVLGLTELLQQTELSAEQRELAQTLKASGRALLALIDTVLDHARVDAGQADLCEQTLDLQALVEDSCAPLRALALGRGVALQVHVSAALPGQLLGDPVRLRQIITNLVGNAIKFSSGLSLPGQVSVYAAPDGPEGWCLSVTDNGVGMDADLCARLFQPFVRGVDGARAGGTGLGLMISQRLAHAMGGEIAVHTRAGKGSCFSLRLPLQRPRVPAAAAQPPPPGSTVLVADDNELNRLILSRQLALLNQDCELVADGDTALQRWRAQPGRYRMLLTDLQMPTMDGHTLARTIRREEAPGQHLPIIALSAESLPGELFRCRAAGMDDHLRKPVDMARLRDVLAPWLAPAVRPA